MKIRILICTALATLLLGVSCRKGDVGEPSLPIGVPHTPNEFNMFHVKLSLHQSADYAMPNSDEITISPTDSVLLDYTIESPEADMYQVAIYKTGGSLPSIRIPITEDMDRRTYSGKQVFYGKDLGAGSTTTYRIWANDKDGVYLGDGGRKLVVHVTSDMNYYTDRRLFLPDSVQGQEPCFISLSEGKLYNYTEAKAHSDAIDLGIFVRQDTSIVFNKDKNRYDTTLAWHNYLYSLGSADIPFGGYDFSGWSKRSTDFTVLVKGGSFGDLNNNYNTVEKIKKKFSGLKGEQTLFPTNSVEAFKQVLAAGYYIFFHTPEDKYGVLLIQSTNTDYRLAPYFQLIWRIER